MDNLLFKDIFESAPGCYLILSPQLMIVAVTDSYLKATMTKRDEILGRHVFDVFPDNPNDLDANGTSNLNASLNRVLQYAAPDTMAIQKYDIRTANGNGDFEVRYWSPTNFPVLGKNQEVKFIIHRAEDVTEFVRLKEKGIREFQTENQPTAHENTLEQIRQSQKMEAMGQLAGGVSHDFNNILAIILMSCDRSIETLETMDQAREGFEHIKKTAKRAAALTRQLLAFSRKQVLLPKPSNLNLIIQDLETMLKRLLVENISLHSKLDEKIGTAMVDPSQIEQIVLNLVVNARDAMPNGGEITIETSNAILDDAMACGNPKVDSGEYVMLAVRDSGMGMNAATQARLFEPFFTTKGIGKGTGLGLSTVYGIVSQNKGTIWVYSELGKGTTFKVYLPLIKEEAQNIVKKESISVPLKGTETVLVVEDQEDLRSLICATLKKEGYEVFEACNGVDAIDVISKTTKNFDLVITDLVMPEMSGNQLAERLSHLLPKTKVLFLSGYAEDTLLHYGVGEQPNFLEKPFTRKSLLSKIRSTLG